MGSLAAWEIGILALLRRIDWMQRWSLNAAPICWAGSSVLLSGVADVKQCQLPYVTTVERSDSEQGWRQGDVGCCDNR